MKVPLTSSFNGPSLIVSLGIASCIAKKFDALTSPDIMSKKPTFALEESLRDPVIDSNRLSDIMNSGSLKSFL